ncbi:ABC transporter permease [Saccharomonospora sp. NPDC046836]|uniref:ABC transporter permease n=1 Tax=Saccharomonospora sp. NPDC046836 TaxID=3156921 RepID=UPI0033C9D47F
MPTLRYLLGRAFGALVTLVLASALSFAILRVVPGDPARLIAGPLATPEALAALRDELGLNDGIAAQYVSYIGGFLSGDWGYSFASGADVSSVLAQRLPATLELALVAFVIAVVGAVVCALLATYRRGWFGTASKSLSLLGLGFPPFWLGLVLLLVFSSWLGVSPGPSGRLSSYLTAPPQITGFYTVDSLLAGDVVAFSDAVAHLALPALALAMLPWAFLTRLLTANLAETATSPYVVVVRSKGVGRWSTHVRHVLHNAALPTITSSGLVFATLITGSVLIEQVFDWPGVGEVLVGGIQRQDFAIVQAFVLLSAVVFIGINFVVDIVNGFVDPRLRVVGARSQP